jgi:hypothetical protein
MKNEVIGNIEEVKERLRRLQPGIELNALMDFCIDASLFNELAVKIKTTETGDSIIRFGSVALLTGILLGMRYTYDYGAPEFVLEQFEELPMFKSLEGD